MRQPGIENEGADGQADHCRGQRPRLQQNRHSQIKNQPVARSGADRSQLVHDRAHHSVAAHGKDDFAHRAFGDNAHLAKGIRQRGLHLFYSGNFSDVDLRALRLRLGLSHPRVAGSLRLVLKENWIASEAVSIAAVGVRPAHRGTLHVCLAQRLSIVLEPGARGAYPEIHQSSGDH